MRRWVLLLVLGVGAAALGVASARAAGDGTTTTATTTTASTTTAPSYAALASSSLPAGCIGAGAGALVSPARVIALGTPASGLGPSAYGSVLAFGSSTSSGAGCNAATVTLSSVSLFDGAVTASSVQATGGNGTVAGLEVDGVAVAASAGKTVPVGGWGELMLGATIGRVTAPLVLRLYQAHGPLPAGTAVMVAFAASALPAPKPKSTYHRQARTRQKHIAGASQPGSPQQQTRTPPQFPASGNPFLTGGHLAPAAAHNGIVSVAMHYLGVPYLWGGASPKTGFDCSGLVQYVFARFGVSLPHYAAAQWHAPGSVWVAPNRLQPGDLVFFIGSDGTRKAPGHVGIYVDDGYIIDAPHTGTFVRIDRLGESRLADGYVGARRIVGASLDARRLAHVSKNAASPHVLPLMLSPQVTGAPPLIATDRTAAHTSASRVYGLWTIMALGCILLLMLVAGNVTSRRHRPAPEAAPSADTTRHN